ncbi:MAG: 3-oxoacyl-ACP reductase FabG [Austwickia sp.]|nr:3-oxoacyl-ACP reductase FabG [Austwickia sp.]
MTTTPNQSATSTPTNPKEMQSYLQGNKLNGRVAFVTGGTRGIGAAISESLASQHAHVAMGFSGNIEKAEQHLALLKDHFPEQSFSLHQGNVGDPESCRRTIQEVIEQHGRLDILVNNAGITKDKVITKMSDQDWYDVINVNLSGTFFLAQEALKHMIERGTGRIVNVSSLIGEHGNIGQANYAASKSGEFGLTKTLAKEACFHLERAGKLEGNTIGITVNTVTPGYVMTEMVATIPQKVLDKIAGGIPVRRIGSPAEIARVVHFLCSDDSGYITGQIWGVNGGQDM